VVTVLDAAGDPAELAVVLQPGGRLASLLGADAAAAVRDDVTVSPVMARTTPEKLTELLGQLVAGRLTAPVAGTFPLDDAAAALEAFRAPRSPARLW